jgi:hypothetical protein
MNMLRARLLLGKTPLVAEQRELNVFKQNPSTQAPFATTIERR